MIGGSAEAIRGKTTDKDVEKQAEAVLNMCRSTIAVRKALISEHLQGASNWPRWSKAQEDPNAAAFEPSAALIKRYY